jgi:hypothetical protein
MKKEQERIELKGVAFGLGCERPRLATGQTQLTATLPHATVIKPHHQAVG